jgi:hypothetical protein
VEGLKIKAAPHIAKAAKRFRLIRRKACLLVHQK